MQNNTSKSSIIILSGSLILLLFLSFFDIFIGSVPIPVSDLFSFFTDGEISETHSVILTEFRIPKMITAILAGAGLSVAGLLMQTIFRNPLAGPYILGISSGASLGVSLLLLGFSSIFGAFFSSFAGNWLIILSAWLGAAAVMLIIFVVSAKVQDVMTILILGVLLGSAISAIVGVLQFLSQAQELKIFVLWTMGSVSGVTKEQLQVFIPVVVLGIFISFFQIKNLDVLLLGENYARSSGLNIFKTRASIFFITSLLAGSITAFCGPIGFVGIVVPHFARSLMQTAMHRTLIPAVALLGANVMLISDILSNLPLFSGTIPINSVTSILGIPFVIMIILKNKI